MDAAMLARRIAAIEIARMARTAMFARGGGAKSAKAGAKGKKAKGGQKAGKAGGPCGANSPGGGGFQKGNTCGGGGAKSSQRAAANRVKERLAAKSKTAKADAAAKAAAGPAKGGIAGMVARSRQAAAKGGQVKAASDKQALDKRQAKNKAVRERRAAAKEAASGKAKVAPGGGKDTMVDAIALSSPGGKMSKRARSKAEERLRQELFGKEGLKVNVPQPSKAASLRQQAGELRGLAARGMKPKAYAKKADQLEAQAKALEKAPSRATPERAAKADLLKAQRSRVQSAKADAKARGEAAAGVKGDPRDAVVAKARAGRTDAPVTEASVNRTIDDLFRAGGHPKAGEDLISIPDVRRVVAAKHGPEAASHAVLDPILKRMRADGKIETMETGQFLGILKPHEADAVLPGVGNDFAWIARPVKNDYRPTGANAKPASTPVDRAASLRRMADKSRVASGKAGAKNAADKRASAASKTTKELERDLTSKDPATRRRAMDGILEKQRLNDANAKERFGKAEVAKDVRKAGKQVEAAKAKVEAAKGDAKAREGAGMIAILQRQKAEAAAKVAGLKAQRDAAATAAPAEAVASVQALRSRTDLDPAAIDRRIDALGSLPAAQLKAVEKGVLGVNIGGSKAGMLAAMKKSVHTSHDARADIAGIQAKQYGVDIVNVKTEWSPVMKSAMKSAAALRRGSPERAAKASAMKAAMATSAAAKTVAQAKAAAASATPKPATAKVTPVAAPPKAVESRPISDPVRITAERAKMDEAFAKAPGSKDNFVTLADLHKTMPHLSRDEFVAVVRKGQAEGKYGLNSSEGRFAPSAETKAAAIKDSSGTLMYISRRDETPDYVPQNVPGPRRFDPAEERNARRYGR